MQKIIPTILTKDPKELNALLNALKGKAQWVHIDIMDGKFVPNISINLFELGEAHNYFNIEIHLMVESPEKYFKDCDEVGAKRVIIHAEAVKNLQKVLDEAALCKFTIGVALNSETSISALKPVKEKIDSLLLMSVVPGFQGQPFIRSAIEKIKTARMFFPSLLIGVDGAVGEENIREIFSAGANYVAIGSRIVRSKNPGESVRKFEEMVQ